MNKWSRYLIAAAVVILGSAMGLFTAGRLDDVEAQQLPLFQVAGRLIDQSTGAALPGKVLASQLLDDGSVVVMPADVGSDGDFVFSGLESGAATILGIATGHGRVVKVVQVDPRTPQELALELPAAVAVEGRLTDPSGRALLGVDVAVEYGDKLLDRVARPSKEPLVLFEGSWESFTSDPTGKFVVSDVDPNRPFELVARHDASGSARRSFPPTSSGTVRAGVEIVVRR